MIPPIGLKNRQNLCIVLLGVGVLAYLVNGFFAHPWTDDYYYSALARDKGFFSAWQHHYNHFNGRYFSISLVLVNPLAYGQLWGYKLIPGVLLAGLAGAIFLFVSAVVKESLPFRSRLIFAMAILLVYLDQMPDIRPGLYWLSGSLTYQAGAILFLAFAALLLRLYTDKPRQKLPAMTTLLILAGCLPGTNEILLFILLPGLLLFLGYDYWRGRNARGVLAIVLATLGAGAAFALLAPGNAARLASYPGNRAVLPAIQQSVAAAFSAIAVWGTTPLLLLVTLLVLATVRENSRLKEILGRTNPVVAASGMILLVTASFFPPYWSTGLYPERRVVNLIYLLFLGGWLINAAALAARFPVRARRICGPACRFTGYTILSGYLIALMFLGHSNFLLVTGDLFSGRSYRYDLELQERYAKLRQSTLVNDEVAPLKNTPLSLFFSDIDSTKEGWVNRSYADYYGKESIVVKKSGQTGH